MASPPAAGHSRPNLQELVRDEFISQIAMLGELMPLRRPSAPGAPTAAPAFPRYLLPSLRIPFRRRRTSESPQSASSSSPTTSEPPSLSTSPTSPVSVRRLSRTRPPTLRCRACSTDLAFHAQIISKCFFGRHGRAYLVSPPSSTPSPTSPGMGSSASPSPTSPLSEFGTLPHHHRHRRNTSTGTATTAGTTATADLLNTKTGRPEDRHLATGLHTVADVTCATCGATVGWKYLFAKNAAQRYKVGKFILETGQVVGFHSWEDVDVPCTVDEGGGNEEGGQGWGAWEGGEVGGEEGRDGEDGVVVFDSEDEDECEDIFAGVWDAKVVAKRRRSRAENIRMGSEFEF